MFQQILSSFGIQGVKVDTILHTAQLSVGQTLQGNIHFQGTSSNKRINAITLQLMTMVEVESADQEYRQAQCIAQWPISAAFELLAHQAHTCPFHLQLPFETPITALNCPRQQTQVWLHTHLDIDWAVDAHDDDHLVIHPNAAMQSVITAMELCGLALYSADVERGQLRGGHFQSSIGCYQELEFRPVGMFNALNEVEVSFVATATQTHILFEVDRKLRGDQYRSLTLHNHYNDVQALTLELKRLLHL